MSLLSNNDDKGKTPRISVNKLAEYMEANPYRRKQIIHDAKFPETFIVTRYGDSRPVIKDFLSGRINAEEVRRKQGEIRDYIPKSDFEVNDQKNCIESLDRLLNADLNYFKDCIISETSGNLIIQMNGLDVSINPDLSVEKMIKGIVHKGAIKIAIAKSALTESAQSVVAVMVWLYVTNYMLEANQKASPKLCCSYDVFNNSFCFCPASYKTRLRHVEHACEEIVSRWPLIKR